MSLAKKSDFVGRAALEKAKAEGPKRKLITLTVDAPVQIYGGESIVHAGKVVGVASSAGWGHTVGKAIAFGYVPTEAAGHADYEIEAYTTRWPAKRIDGAAVDPETDLALPPDLVARLRRWIRDYEIMCEPNTPVDAGAILFFDEEGLVLAAAVKAGLGAGRRVFVAPEAQYHLGEGPKWVEF